MKRILWIMFLLIVTSCEYPYVNKYWWIKNETDDSLRVSFTIPSQGIVCSGRVIPAGDSTLINKDQNLERFLKSSKAFFEEDFVVDSICLQYMDGKQAAFFERNGAYRMFSHSSWAFYTPLGYDYNYVWVYELNQQDLIDESK